MMRLCSRFLIYLLVAQMLIKAANTSLSVLSQPVFGSVSTVVLRVARCLFRCWS